MTYDHKRWHQLIQSQVERINKLAEQKGGEYAGDVDRLANFRRNGERLGVPMELVWAVYAGKHWDAVQQYVQDMVSKKERTRAEPISGRVDDLIVYLILFQAILEERNVDKISGVPRSHLKEYHGPVPPQQAHEWTQDKASDSIA